MTFRDLGLIAPILKALDDQGYVKPSPIQEKAIPPALKGRDVLGLAQTGTGKTCAFGAPILQRLHSAPSKAGRPVRALILTPTRELAIQIEDSFTAYGKNLPLKHTVIFGGVGQGPQVEKLNRGVDILTATPGRLLDLQGQGLLDLSGVEIFVLDEADRMLDMGFIHDVRRVLKLLPQKKQTMLFSATMPREITELVDNLLHDPVKVAVDPVSSPVERIRQSLYFVDKANKTKLLALLVEELKVKNALVFTRTKHGANKVAGDLGKSGITAAAIHGNKSQTARQQALSDFKAGRVQVLVATDIAARGIDIEELSHVFNYNLPEVPETYVHRIGRTGRAGHGGTAVAFCDFTEKPLLKEIEKLMGKAIPVVEDHPYPMENFTPVVKDAKGRVVNAEDAEARAAARERKKARQAASQSTPPAPERKKSGKRQAQSAPEPAPKAAKEQPSKRGVRQQRLKETMPAAPTMPQADFYRPDPLASDHIMDATARLLAPRKLTLSKPTAPVSEPSGSKKPRRRKRGGQSGEAAAPAVSVPVQKAPKKAQRQTQRQPDSLKQPKGKESRSRSGAPRRADSYARSHVKDSTEQKSLMKPYYIEHD